MNNARKIAGFTLIGIIVIFTFFAILGIWEVIDIQKVAEKSLKSLLLVFVSSAVVLFITSVLIKDDNSTKGKLE